MEDDHCSSFLDYKKILFGLRNDLERLAAFSSRLGLAHSTALIAQVRERLEGDGFTIAVVGEFKRGKSTFINALLGREILPADTLPCSATLNRVTYGLEPRVEIRFVDGRVEVIGIDDLDGYVTKLTPEAEAVAATVREAVVHFDVAYCQNGVDIIDTPGLNDDETMTEVTSGVLPAIDAAILVISATSPLSQYEREFLESRILPSDLGRVIFVVNGIDRCHSEADAERVVAAIEERIRRQVIERARRQHGEDSTDFEAYRRKIGEPRVFGLSAHQALRAKLEHDSELLARSRFPVFEEALEAFLTRGRAATFLQVPLNRIISSAAEILRAITLEEQALRMREEEFRQAYEASMASIQEVHQRTRQELAKVDQAAEEVKGRVYPLVQRMAAVLEAAAMETIDGAEVTAADLRDPRSLADRLGGQVSAAVQRAARAMAAEIQAEVERGVAREIDRLVEFSRAVGRLLEDIDLEFDEARPRAGNGGGDPQGGTAAVLTAVLSGLGGVWSGFRQVGAAGAAAGAAGSLGTVAVASLVIHAFGLPLSWPAMLVAGLGSAVAGGALIRAVFTGLRERRFKRAYKAEVRKVIAQQLRESGVGGQVDRHIVTTFRALKGKVEDEIGASLEDIQQKLNELSARRSRDETLTEAERTDLRSMRRTTEEILANARRLSLELAASVEA